MTLDNSDKGLTCFRIVSNEQLHQWVEEACKHPVGSVQRQKNLTKIIRSLTHKLWKERTLYYQDALQQTWLFFCQNICEGNTGQPYDPNRASLVTWLNFYLKQRLHDFRIYHQREKARTILTPNEPWESSDRAVDLVETIPARPDVPPLLEEVKKWVQTDPTGELSCTHIKQHPEVTCQVLILRRLPPETSWKTLSHEFNLSISTLSSFYQHKCLPRLREFGESQGYL